MTFRYINNWITQLVEPLPAGWDSLPVPQDRLNQLMSLKPGEEFRITVTQSANPLAQSAFEVLSVTKTGDGRLVLARGQEGTDDRIWPAGSVVFAGVTAGMLQSIVSALSSVATATGETLVLSAATSRAWLCNLVADTTVAIDTAEVGQRLDVVTVQDQVGGHKVTWPGSVMWSGSTELGPAAGQASKAELLSLGANQWLGSMLVYDPPSVQQLPALYAAAWLAPDRLSLNIALFNSDGQQVSSTNITEENWNTSRFGMAVSADGGYIALNLYDRGQGADTWLFNTADWSSININAPIASFGPCRVPFVIHDDALYGVSAHGTFPGFTCYRVMLASGVRTDLFEVPGEVQSISARSGEVTCTSNNAMGYSGTPRPATWTFDLGTMALAATQFPLPAGAELSTSTPSPDGAGGAYSPDGERYGLFTKLYYPAEDVSRSSIIIYNARTRAIQMSVDVPGTPQAWWHNPFWSPNGKWFGVLLNDGGLSAVLQLSTQEVTVTPGPGVGGEEFASTAILTNTGELIFGVNTFRAVKGETPVVPMLNVPAGYHLLLASN